MKIKNIKAAYVNKIEAKLIQQWKEKTELFDKLEQIKKEIVGLIGSGRCNSYGNGDDAFKIKEHIDGYKHFLHHEIGEIAKKIGMEIMKDLNHEN